MVKGLEAMENKSVRFRQLCSRNCFDLERQSTSEDEFYATRARKSKSRIWYGIYRGWAIGSEDGRYKSRPTEKKCFVPDDPFLQKWNKIFVFACALAISLDPLFFYIPVINRNDVCLKLDKKLETTACVLRTVIDAFYILRIIFQFRTGFIVTSSRVFGRGELVQDPGVIAKRYLTSHFIVDILSILPLPQMVVLDIIPNLGGLVSLVTKSILEVVIFVQYVPRFMRIYPLYKEVTSMSGMLTETAWAGAVYNLVLYLLASHIMGALWYILSIERGVWCWHDACKRSNTCISSNLFCGGHKNTLASGVAYSLNFPQKFLYCFWWGLRSVSSLGQNLKTSTFGWEILFAIFISIAGLVLFALLIGNMQKYLQFLQSTTERIQEMRVKRRDAERWMSNRGIPDYIKERIRDYEEFKWQSNRGVEEQTLIRSFPKDVRRDVNRHLWFSLIRRVPLFETLDEQVLDALCDCLKPVRYTKDSSIIYEGDPVDEILFIKRGILESATTNGGMTGFYNATHLKPGDFSGEELLTWALDPSSSSILPVSTRTVRTLSVVEAYALVSEDLKCVVSQFRFFHNNNIQHLFRFYSQQWRTWASCYIQASWRRYWKKKAEEDLQKTLASEAATRPSLGATLYASSFAANMLRNIRQNEACPGNFPQRLQLLPSKPSEPIFSLHGHSET